MKLSHALLGRVDRLFMRHVCTPSFELRVGIRDRYSALERRGWPSRQYDTDSEVPMVLFGPRTTRISSYGVDCIAEHLQFNVAKYESVRKLFLISDR